MATAPVQQNHFHHPGMPPCALGDEAWKAAQAHTEGDGVIWDDFTNEEVIKRVGMERAAYYAQGDECAGCRCSVLPQPSSPPRHCCTSALLLCCPTAPHLQLRGLPRSCDKRYREAIYLCSSHSMLEYLLPATLARDANLFIPTVVPTIGARQSRIQQQGPCYEWINT
mmetsp:Transcript_814/g.1308  ORF Transcript_814/g.1308 Transcript_814/m.1308 type:complete len:168 (+) Transcript_814:476-979(+)